MMLDGRSAYDRAEGTGLTAGTAVDANLLIYDEYVFHRGRHRIRFCNGRYTVLQRSLQ